LKLRLAAPAVIVDVGRVEELKKIKVDGGAIRIGGGVTHAAIAANAELNRHCPLLCETASQIGDQQIRNRGTIGGSLAHADPAADWPAAILALEAEVVARSSSGERVIKASDFFVDVMTSAIEPNEIVTEVRVPRPAQPNRGVYLKVPQSASGFAVVGVATQINISGGACEDVSIGVTGLAPKAFRAASAEAALRGRTLDEATVSAAAARADAEATDVMEDVHASGDYRRHLARVYVRRAVHEAAARM
jgi:carbon-monoxide dehydrogenase medium subunit